MRRELSAGGVVARRMRGRWWIATIRPRRDDGRVVWALPKGLVDPGEEASATALREVSEETGLRCRLEGTLGHVRYTYTWDGERIFKIVSFFLLRPVGGQIGAIPPGMELEVSEARWLPLDDAVQALTYRGEREMVDRASAMLTGEGFP